MAGNGGLVAGMLALSVLSGVLVVYAERGSAPEPAVPTAFVERAPHPDAPLGPTSAPASPAHVPPVDTGEYAFTVPSGRPSSVSCADARAVVRQMRSTLAYAPPSVGAQVFATATADWLDPTGLWSASPDSPIPEVIDRQAAQLLHDLEGSGSEPCEGARGVGEALVAWVAELTARFEAPRRDELGKRGAPTPGEVGDAALEAVFEDDTRPAARVARELGEHIGVLERGLGDPIAPYADAARARLFPPFDRDQWAGVVLAAGLRAYAQILDPHGAWAPRDEEASVYDVDLDPHPPERLWDKSARVAIGVRVDSNPMEPLEVGDVVLSIAGVATAGLPLEQLDQLVYATTDTPASAPLVVLRRGEQELRTLELPAQGDAPESEALPAALPSYRVAYGTGDALVVEIHDVRSDLGEALAAVIRKQESEDRRHVEGLVLDLRDDGGGSTDGAIHALGLFLPGAPLFPLARRDGSIEVDRAPEPPTSQRWNRPVASLVDGDTASAAEMIAGALLAYRRGPVVGQPTYGKGCAQEYLDDDVRAGVLRLTTMLYALPDGSPVQGVGLEPSILLPADGFTSARVDGKREREADALNAPPTWRGPDVRDPTLLVPATSGWPDPHGKVGPCQDPRVCRALFALGAGAPGGKRPPTAFSTSSPAPGHR